MKLWFWSLCCVCLLLLSAPWTTVKPMSEDLRCKCGHSRESHFINSKPVMCDFEGACPAGCTEFVPAGAPTVPRIARSLDDLRPGMHVVWTAYDHEDWTWLQLSEETIDPFHWEDVDFAAGQVVILAAAPDPPARDWLVPATQMEALREALVVWGRDYISGSRGDLLTAARAVLDAAREVEHE